MSVMKLLLTIIITFFDVQMLYNDNNEHYNYKYCYNYSSDSYASNRTT